MTKTRLPAYVLLIALAVLPGCFLWADDDAGDDVTPTDCTTNGDCVDGEVCAANRCVAENSVGQGGMCSANRDCATGLFCSPVGVCAPAGSGDEGDACSSGAECLPTLVCELYGFGGTCVGPGDGDLGDGCAASGDCIAGLACGAGETCVPAADAFPPFTGVTCPADAAPFEVFFQVPRTGAPISDFFRLPFPNDARINEDGTLNLSDFPRPGPSIIGVDIVDLYADALSEDFDGFSSVANITFRMSKEFDFDTIGDNGANVLFVDITDPLAPEFGSNRGRAFSYDSGTGLYECQHTFQVAPQRHDPLLPNHTYAVWLNNDIRSAAGETPVQDADLVAVLGATAPADPTLARVWTQYANFRAYLADAALTAADVAGVTVFTVQDTTGKAEKIAAAVESGALPTLSDLTLCDGVNVSPCALPGDTDRVCGTSAGNFWEIQGRMSVPNFQQGQLPYEFPVNGGGITYDVNGDPVLANTIDVCFALTVPKAAPSNATSGYPLVVHAHGTGGNFRAAITNNISSALAGAGNPMATLTFDGIAHGERRGTSTRDSDGLVFNVVNPRAARDNHLQGAVDAIQAMRVAQVASFDVGTVTGINLDPNQTFYFGHSQGSNVGIIGVGVTDLARGAVFSGAGSYLSEGILSKTSPVNAADALSVVVGEALGNGHPIMTIWQTFFDRIDPVNFDPLMITRPPAGVASKHVYMTWGQDDTYSPESTMNITARAMRLQVIAPELEAVSGLTTVASGAAPNRTGGDGPSRVAAMGQFASDGTYDGHFVSTRVQAAIDDWLAFLQSTAAGAPVVP